jgi:MFS family permease
MSVALARRSVARTEAMTAASPAAPAPVKVGRASLLRLSGYRWLLLAHLISQLGDGLYNVALPWMVWQHTHSGIQTTATLAASSFSFLVVGPIAGVYVDRWDRKRTLIGADLARAALLIALPAILFAGFNLIVVLMIAVLLPAFGRFFVPAQRAAVPSLVKQDQLVAANGLMLGVGNAAYIAGPAAAGLLLIAIGAAPLLVLDGLSFALSALCLSAVTFGPRAASAAKRRSFRSDFAEGFRVTWRTPQLRAISLIAVLNTVCFAPVPALLPLWVTEHTHPAQLFGMMTSSFFVGSVVGSLLIAKSGRRFSRGTVIVASLLAMGCAIAAFGRTNQALVGGLALGLLGCFLSTYNVGVMTVLQLSVAGAVLGRVFAVNETFSWSLRAVAILGSGAIADRAGVHGTLVVLGATLMCVGALAAFSPVWERRSSATTSVAHQG